MVYHPEPELALFEFSGEYIKRKDSAYKNYKTWKYLSYVMERECLKHNIKVDSLLWRNKNL